MKNKIPLIISILLIFSFLSGCNAVKKTTDIKQETLLTNNVLDASLRENIGFQMVEKNDFLELYADGKTTEVAIKVLKTGKMWYSNPLDKADDSVAEPNNKMKLSSQIDLVYNNESDKESGMNNFVDSIDINQFEFAKIEKGLRITYTIGKQKKIFIVPQVITAKRFEEKILSKLDETSRESLLARYNFYSLKDAGSETIKAEWISKYPRVEQEDLYVITENLAEFVMTKIEKITSPTGYTYEDLVQDNEYNKVAIPEQPTSFKIPIDYIIDGESFVAKVLTQYITCPDDVKITDLRLLSFFGAANMKDDGYIFVPDGCGALINLNNGKSNLPPYNNELYGEDLTSMKAEKLIQTKQSYLPVYGIKKGDSAFLAIIESGDAIASINAYVSGMLNGYNCVYPSFELTQKTKMKVSYDRSNDLNIFQKSKFDKDLAIRYFFLDGESADYSGMASKYQNYLMDSGKLKKTEVEKTPFYLELIGAVEYTDSFMGIPVNTIKPLTSFEQAKTIVQTLNDGGVENVVLRYLGWANDGIENYNMNRIDVISKLGGEKALENLNESINEKGNRMFLDVDLQYIYQKKNFDGYSSIFDSPKTILGETAYTSKNNLATGKRYYKIDVITPTKYKVYSDRIIKDLNKLKINNVSLANLSKDLYSDFNKQNVLDRQDAYGLASSVYEQYSKNGYGILSDSANVYALANASHVINLPDSSNQNYCIDNDIPFYQMVLHGIIPYSEDAINLSSDYKTSVLKMMESGSNIHFKWMYMQNKELKKIDTGYYAVSYKEWIDQAIALYNECNITLAEVRNSKITYHRIISENVTKTQYGNGISIYVNYNKEKVSVDNIEIDALNYKMVKGAVK